MIVLRHVQAVDVSTKDAELFKEQASYVYRIKIFQNYIQNLEDWRVLIYLQLLSDGTAAKCCL